MVLARGTLGNNVRSALIVHRMDAMEFFNLIRSCPCSDDTKSLVKLILELKDVIANGNKR
jgi:hypothetical protein